MFLTLFLKKKKKTKRNPNTMVLRKNNFQVTALDHIFFVVWLLQDSFFQSFRASVQPQTLLNHFVDCALLS